MKTTRSFLLGTLGALMLLGSCTKEEQSVPHVVILGFDGLSSEVVQKYPERFPLFGSLSKSGSSTFEMRSVLPSSSAVNWASHLMGAGPELHGYTTWGSQTPDLPSRVVTENGTFPCIFWATKQAFPESESVVAYNWGGIGYLYDTLSVEHSYSLSANEDIVEAAKKHLKDKPKLSFFYFAEPDGAGHTHGWQSEQYMLTASRMDSLASIIVQEIKASGMYDNTVILYVSDHGGTGTGHGGKTMVEMQVPFAISGPGIKAGHKINSSTMVYDMAATVAKTLGVPRPQVWVGRPIEEAFITNK